MPVDVCKEHLILGKRTAVVNAFHWRKESAIAVGERNPEPIVNAPKDQVRSSMPVDVCKEHLILGKRTAVVNAFHWRKESAIAVGERNPEPIVNAPKDQVRSSVPVNVRKEHLTLGKRTAVVNALHWRKESAIAVGEQNPEPIVNTPKDQVRSSVPVDVRKEHLTLGKRTAVVNALQAPEFIFVLAINLRALRAYAH